MIKKLTLRQKAAIAGVGVLAASTSGVAWAYLTSYGNGTAQAGVAASPPFVNGSQDTGSLVPNVMGAVGISITNPLSDPVEITQIPIGSSIATAGCPANSVQVGGKSSGVIVASGDGVNPILRSDTQTTQLAAGETGLYMLWGLFDTASFPEGDASNNQDGCLGATLDLAYGPVSFQMAP